MIMSTLGELPVAYQAALDELSDAVGNACALAELLDYFAGQLRGEHPDLAGPPLEASPTPSQIRRALERRDQALSEVEKHWQRLPGELRDLVPLPEEVLAGEGLG
jgi:hypothetical protein